MQGFKELLKNVAGIHTHEKSDSPDLYSIRASEIECIANGKAHKKYELGLLEAKSSVVLLPTRMLRSLSFFYFIAPATFSDSKFVTSVEKSISDLIMADKTRN